MLLKRKPQSSDPLDNVNLEAYIEKLPYQWIERLGRGVEIYKLEDLQAKSAIYCELIKSYLKVPRKINGNRYSLNWGYVERIGPDIRKPDQNKLKFKVEKVIADAREVIKI